VHHNEDMEAATLIANSVVADLRSKDYSAEHGNIRLHMHSTYLPLASQTQFVESAVKEAKLAASTDRSEQIRTCIAIIRSPTPLGKAEKNANTEKIKSIIESALERSTCHSCWRRHQVGSQCDSQFNTVSHALTKQGHFQQERCELKRTQVDEEGIKFKRQNVAQQTKQQHLMPMVTGLIPHGKLFTTKEGHMDDLKTELLFRCVPEDQIPSGTTERKSMLKIHEHWRLLEEEGADDATAKTQSDKHFKNQSGAPFKIDG